LGYSFSSELESDPELSAFLADFFGAGFSSLELSSELSAFLATFFGAGFSSELDSEELESFLAAFLDGFLTTLTDSSDESESEDDSTFAFFYGTTAFSVFFCALLALPLEAAETLEAALSLFLTGLASDESESDDDSTFFLDFDFLSFLTSLTGSAFFSTFSFFSFLSFFLSTFFGDGETDELSESDTTGFFVFLSFLSFPI